MRKIDLTDFKVATSETARDINRRILLNLIRRLEPVSRADLARRSGLQRSTVSAIAEQLISERWVIEGTVGRAPRGRRPTLLYLNKQRAGVIGVDIRAVTTTIGLANLNLDFVEQESLATGSRSGPFMALLRGRIKRLIARHPEVTYEGIGVTLPGRVDLSSHCLVFAPNLGWGKVDLKTPLEQATGLSVELENAANACALAELWGGRHPDGVRNLVAVTVSEGIGVGMILNGQLARGSTGLAGEFGHIVLLEEGPRCRCGNRGCWEVCGSNSAAVRYYMEASKRSVRARPTPPNFEEILRLAGENDPQATAALDRMAHYLGCGLAMLLTALAPEVLVLVGEVTRAWDRVGPIVHAVMNQRLPTRPNTRILPTDPAIQPRLRGAIALVLQKHFSYPSTA